MMNKKVINHINDKCVLYKVIILSFNFKKMILCKKKLRYRLYLMNIYISWVLMHVLNVCLVVYSLKKLQSCNKVSHIRQKYLHYLCLVMWNKDFCYCNNKSWHWLSYMFFFVVTWELFSKVIRIEYVRILLLFLKKWNNFKYRSDFLWSFD